MLQSLHVFIYFFIMFIKYRVYIIDLWWKLELYLRRLFSNRHSIAVAIFLQINFFWDYLLDDDDGRVMGMFGQPQVKKPIRL